jgi:hypothetical protein
MSDAEHDRIQPGDPHADDVHDGTAHPDAHVGGHGTEAKEPLGPIDVAAWAYALVGAGLGVVVAISLYLAAT